jgi:DNA-binding NtrC family response regulator
LEIGKTTRARGAAGPGEETSAGKEARPGKGYDFLPKEISAYAPPQAQGITTIAPALQPQAAPAYEIPESPLTMAHPQRTHSAAVLESWVAADPASARLLQEVRGIAASASTVLIRGESGTGKDLLASVIHYLGPQSDDPLVKIDCASLPTELLESELFGYEKGAFTGASHTKVGRLELAGAGTIVLDEIAALTMTISVNARLIALTNVDLERAVARHTFREDLYYRLNVIPIAVPALRERPADMRPIAEHFLAQLVAMHRKPRMTFAAAAMEALQAYSYPGNVRELRNIIERAVVTGAGPEILPQDLPAHVREAAPAGKKMSLEDLERSYIAEVLDFTRGKKTMAAQILGISRKTLLEKRKRYGLD